MNKRVNLIAIAIIPAIIALLAVMAGIQPAGAQSSDDSYETTTTTESTTTTAVTSTTTTVAPTTTTIPTTTTVPPEVPEYNAKASAKAKCDDTTGNVIVLVTFRGDALETDGSLLILLDDVEMADMVYSPGEIILEEGELRLNQPATAGGVVTFVVNSALDSFEFTAEYPAVAVCPQTSSTSIVANPQPPSYVSTRISTPVPAPAITTKPAPLSFTG